MQLQLGWRPKKCNLHLVSRMVDTIDVAVQQIHTGRACRSVLPRRLEDQCLNQDLKVIACMKHAGCALPQCGIAMPA